MAVNCEPRKIDSNSTGLAFAETICGRLPTLEDDGYLPVWYEREPNEYDDFGGEIATMARTPINASRQRKKGVTVDFDAMAGWNEDWTQNNMNRLLQGFMFSEAREKATTFPINGEAVDVLAAVAVGNGYNLSGGASKFRENQLVKVSGFVSPNNNGLKIVTGVAGNTVSVAGNAITNEDGTEKVKIEAVGYQFEAGEIALIMLGGIPLMNYTGGVATAADGTVTFSDVGEDGDTITVGDVVYTLAAAPVIGSYDVPIGGTAAATAANLVAAIMGNIVGMSAHPQVTASAAGAVVTVTAKIAGASGNGIELAEASADAAVSSATLTDGAGVSLLELGLIPGEWIYLGGDSATTRLTDALTGFARIGTIDDQNITFDKTTFAPVANAGAGKTVQLFTGFVIKNEKEPERIVTHYYEFERTLGKDADGIQAEYVTAAVANELTLNIPVSDKLNVDIGYVGRDVEQRTGAEGRKLGPKAVALGESAINTSSNVVRMRMAVIDPATSRPSALFAYITEGSLTINNSVEGVKAIGTLGNIDVSTGDFEVGGELTALFQTVNATKAVRNNADVTLDFIVAANNSGFVFDIPLLSLGGGRPEIESGEPVTVSLETFGAENPNGYTLLYTNFPYLPTFAHPKQNSVY
jgi:hypothetical protein